MKEHTIFQSLLDLSLSLAIQRQESTGNSCTALTERMREALKASSKGAQIIIAPLKDSTLANACAPDPTPTTEADIHREGIEAERADAERLQREAAEPEPSGPRVRLHEEIEGERIDSGWQFYEDEDDILGVIVHAEFTFEQAQQVAAGLYFFLRRGENIGIIRGQRAEQRKYKEVFSNIFSPIVDAIRKASDQ